jgi:hypothetical protein
MSVQQIPGVLRSRSCCLPRRRDLRLSAVHPLSGDRAGNRGFGRVGTARLYRSLRHRDSSSSPRLDPSARRWRPLWSCVRFLLRAGWSNSWRNPRIPCGALSRSRLAYLTQPEQNLHGPWPAAAALPCYYVVDWRSEIRRDWRSDGYKARRGSYAGEPLVRLHARDALSQ